MHWTCQFDRFLALPCYIQFISTSTGHFCNFWSPFLSFLFEVSSTRYLGQVRASERLNRWQAPMHGPRRRLDVPPWNFESDIVDFEPGWEGPQLGNGDGEGLDRRARSWWETWFIQTRNPSSMLPRVTRLQGRKTYRWKANPVRFVVVVIDLPIILLQLTLRRSPFGIVLKPPNEPLATRKQTKCHNHDLPAQGVTRDSAASKQVGRCRRWNALKYAQNEIEIWTERFLVFRERSFLIIVQD